MQQLFLTSSVNFVAHDLVKHIDLSKGNKLAFITTPAELEDGDMQWLADDRQALVDAGFDVFDYTITGKTKKQLEEALDKVDILYLSGGNTLHLMEQAHETGFFELAKAYIKTGEKIYIGTSAGSIAAGERCPDYLLEEAETKATTQASGFGFVNFTVLPHWGSDIFRKLYLGGRLEIAYKKTQVPLIILTDSQYIKVKESTFEVIDTHL